MKNKTLILCSFVALLFVTACENTQVAANYSGNTNGTDGIVSAQVTTGDDHTQAGLNGAYNLATGDYQVGFIITLNRVPDEYLRQQLVRAGAIRHSDTEWVLPAVSERDVHSPVFLALRACGNAPGGARIKPIKVTSDK